jgi:hypothetical protein
MHDATIFGSAAVVVNCTVPAHGAWLVELNLRGDDDPRLERVRALIEKA